MQNMADPDGLPAGTEILDSTGKLVGSLDTSNSQKGYLAVLKGIFITKSVFLPRTAVDHVGDDGIHLNLSKDELQDSRFAMPPD